MGKPDLEALQTDELPCAGAAAVSASAAPRGGDSREDCNLRGCQLYNESIV